MAASDRGARLRAARWRVPSGRAALKSGPPEMPSSAPHRASTPTSSSSLLECARVARAADERRNRTCPSGARIRHLDDSHDPAMMLVFSTRGTTKPEPFSGCATASRLKPKVTVALEAYGISPHRRGEFGIRRPRSSVAFANAGVHTTTAGADTSSPVAARRAVGAARRNPCRVTAASGHEPTPPAALASVRQRSPRGRRAAT